MLARFARLKAELKGSAKISFDEILMQSKYDQLRARELTLAESRLASAEAEAAQIDVQIEQVQNQIRGIDGQYSALKSQLDIVNKSLADLEELLAKGVLEAPRLRALQLEQSVLLGQKSALAAKKSELKQKIAELELIRIRVQSHLTERANANLIELRPKLFALAERRNILKRQIENLTIRAPFTGYVHGSEKLGVGSSIQAGESIFHIIRADRPKIVQLLVDPNRIEEVYHGQPVTIRVSSAAGLDVPEFSAEIARISADRISTKETGVSFYRAALRFTDGEDEKFEAMNLPAGMSVDAFIQLGKRRPIEYLLAPILSYWKEGTNAG